MNARPLAVALLLQRHRASALGSGDHAWYGHRTLGNIYAALTKLGRIDKYVRV